MRKKKYSIEYFKNLAINKKGLCLSTEYITCSSKLEFQCENGHIWKTKPYYLVNNNTWCPKCYKSHKDNIELFHEIAKEHGGFCLSTEYVNCRTKLEFQCENGHVWKTKPRNVKHSKSWCPVCSNCIKLTIEQMQIIASKRNGKCLSTEYINSHSKLLWMCEKEHQWMAKPYLIKNSKHWCPFCNESKGEICVVDFLMENKILFERQKTFKDCKGIKQQLPFDFYLSNYNILIEYDGLQHFEPVNFNGCSDEKALETHIAIKRTDEIKNNYCLANNINLIRISYKEKNIEDYLNEYLTIYLK